jgi:hypothetical protein
MLSRVQGKRVMAKDQGQGQDHGQGNKQGKGPGQGQGHGQRSAQGQCQGRLPWPTARARVMAKAKGKEDRG